MAGLPSHTKKKQSARSSRSVNREGEGLPRVGKEKAEGSEVSPALRTGQKNTSFGNANENRSAERHSSTQRELSVQSTRSANSPPDLLWITTDKPADFKDAKIQRMISRHVMRDYQQKDQSKKESSRATRHKSSTKSPSDDDASVASSTSQLSLKPTVDFGRVYHISFVLNSSKTNIPRDMEPETPHPTYGPHPSCSSARHLLKICSTRCASISVPQSLSSVSVISYLVISVSVSLYCMMNDFLPFTTMLRRGPSFSARNLITLHHFFFITCVLYARAC